MKKLGTTLLLALCLMSVVACGKKKENNTMANNYCGPQYGYAQGQCGAYAYNGMNGQIPGQIPGQYGQMCQVGMIQTQYGCLQQGPCASLGNYGYHPTALNGMPGCVIGTSNYGGYPQQQYGYPQQYGGGVYGGMYGQPGF